MDHQDNNIQHTDVASKIRTGEHVDLERWAQLVADGQVPFPPHLESSAQEAILHRVAHLRRSRLLKFIARVIASDLLQSRRPTEEYRNHVETKDI